MKKILSMMGLVALLFLTLSCDSLWKISDGASVEFPSVFPPISNANGNMEVVVTLHKSSNNVILAKKTLSVKKAQSTNVVFDRLTTNEKIYAKVEVLNEESLFSIPYYRARSADAKVRTGKNVFITKPIALFYTTNGVSCTSDGSAVIIDPIDNNKRTNEDVLHAAYEKMSANGRLLPDATIYVNDILQIEKNEHWNFSNLLLRPNNTSSLVATVKSEGNLVLENVAIMSNLLNEDPFSIPAILSVENCAAVTIQGMSSVDALQYEPSIASPYPVRVANSLHKDSKIVLKAMGATAGTVLVENAGGSFTASNFLFNGETELDEKGNLIVKKAVSPETNMPTVTFDIADGTGNTIVLEVGEDGTAVFPSDPTRDAHTFGGWFTRETVGSSYADPFDKSTVITENITLYANWKSPIRYTHQWPEKTYTVYSVDDSITGDVVIPSTYYTVQYGELPVTAIRENAFSACSELTGITLPDSITSLGEWSFHNCRKLEFVSLGEGISVISSRAFSHCTALTTINFPKSLTKIEGNAFENCSSLNIQTFPETITYIGGGAFFGNWSLTKVTVPETVSFLGSAAFAFCRNLEEVHVNVTKPYYYESLGEGIFEGCEKLTTVTFGDNIDHIPEYTFEDCAAIETITIGDNIKTIGDSAFLRCYKLKDVNFSPNSKLHTIGLKAFSRCSALETFTIPSSVGEMGLNVFEYCFGLSIISEATEYSANINWDPEWNYDAHYGYIPVTWSAPTDVTYTVTFMLDYIDYVTEYGTAIVVNEGETITLPEHPTKEGYYFRGWETAQVPLSRELFTSSSIVSKNMVLYATFGISSRNYNYVLNSAGDGFIFSVHTPPNSSEHVFSPGGNNIVEIAANAYDAWDNIGENSITSIKMNKTVQKIAAQAIPRNTTVAAADNQGTLFGYATTLGGDAVYYLWSQAYDANVDVYPVWRP